MTLSPGSELLVAAGIVTPILVRDDLSFDLSKSGKVYRISLCGRAYILGSLGPSLRGETVLPFPARLVVRADRYRRQKSLGHDVGQVVSVLAFYSVGTSSIPAEIYNFSVKNC